jgi:acetylornithine deacetylase
LDARSRTRSPLRTSLRADPGHSPFSWSTTTDARRFARRGIPATCVGPQASDIHGIDEAVSLASMHDVAGVLARFMVAWCGTDRTPEASVL